MPKKKTKSKIKSKVKKVKKIAKKTKVVYDKQQQYADAIQTGYELGASLTDIAFDIFDLFR